MVRHAPAPHAAIAAATIHDQPYFALRLSLAARPELSFIGRSTFDFRKRVLV
ncbi:Hypothetical protein RY69_2166 [Bifidobacterium breve]|uniref:hypothetical protein n=1 Tax=Bifidobacterium breve TaxID=1685 RepID=UPI0006CB495E|nr:hypothetical protein [Bifidobacterium breve]ALE14374.1 Hypothetical protein RY69_2166 [Bifidobacterium breve]